MAGVGTEARNPAESRPQRASGPNPRAFSSAASALLATVAGAPIVLVLATSSFGSVRADLPAVVIDLGASFVRMLSAYVLSLGFALVYGYVAATSRIGEKVLIPLLDIFQSIPILGFFPVAIVFFVGLTPGSIVGPNLASIFLIFTSMAWNMVFGVYESLKSVPSDLREAADSFDVRGFQRIRQVLVPGTINRLVYNTVLSWTAGWYFLVAAEFISTASSSTTLPGIGTYLLRAAAGGDTTALITGLAVLVALIAALDILVWRPLGRWAERYRYDQAPSGEGEILGGPKPRTPLVRAAGFVRRGFASRVSRAGTPFFALAFLGAGRPGAKRRPFARSAARYAALGTTLVVAWLLLIELIVGVVHVATGPILPSVRAQIDQVPLALVRSAGRLILAYMISIGIALPLAVGLSRRPKAAKIGFPAVEILASVPATALFPVFVFALAHEITAEGASVLMLVTGMVWYLFFNLVSGVRAIPPDLEEAAKSYGLLRSRYRRRLLFPAIFPAFVTGSITAFGGGWNTLVIAEYLQGGSRATTFQVPGIGGLIDVGNGELGGLPLMLVALLTMVLTVVAVNELLWKPLYRKAVDKYRYD